MPNTGLEVRGVRMRNLLLWAFIAAIAVNVVVTCHRLHVDRQTAEARVDLLSAALERCAAHRDRLSRECR